jgi:hypothetical protein
VVLAAEQYALRLVLPSSQRMSATRWASHKDIAAKALKKLAGPHVPASLTKLEHAVKRAHNAHAKAEQAHHDAQHAARRRAEQPAGDTPDESATEPPEEEDLDELDAEAV